MQIEPFGQGAVDAPGQVVEVGVGGVDGDAVPDEADDGAARLVVGGDAAQTAEDEGMVGDDEVEAQGDGLVGDGGGEVEGYEDAGAGNLPFADEESGVVVIFLEFRMKGGVEPRRHLAYCGLFHLRCFFCFYNAKGTVLLCGGRGYCFVRVRPKSPRAKKRWLSSGR